MNQGKTRSSLFGVVGGYLLYLAYQLFESWNNPDTTMSHAVMAIFIALFAIAGCFLFVCAVRMWKRADQEEQEEKKRAADENSLK